MKQTIDWDLARNRLRASERALEEATAESPERIEKAYRQRAIRLAATQADPGLFAVSLPVLVFRLAEERYAIELSELAEAAELSRYTPVPGSPPAFPGVVNLRGEIRAVLDLGRLLGLSQSVEPSDRAEKAAGFILVLRRGGQICLRVDAIEELGEIRPEHLTPALHGKYAKGLTRSTVPVLSVDAVLAETISKEDNKTTWE